MSEANKAIVRQIVDQIQNRHELAGIDTFFMPDFINHVEAHEASSELNAAQRAKIAFAQLFSAFPDLNVTIHDQLAEGDKVMTRKVLRGTHQGLFIGVEPTGKQIEFEVIDIVRLENGKVVEHWAIQDRLALMQQLGLIPAAEAA